MTIALESLSPALQTLVQDAKRLYSQHHGSSAAIFCTVAPGRVNLIGEHTDYTGGFVLPLAIDFGTVVYGSGAIVEGETTTGSVIELISSMAPDKVEKLTIDMTSIPSLLLPITTTGPTMSWVLLHSIFRTCHKVPPCPSRLPSLAMYISEEA